MRWLQNNTLKDILLLYIFCIAKHKKIIFGCLPKKLKLLNPNVALIQSFKRTVPNKDDMSNFDFLDPGR